LERDISVLNPQLRSATAPMESLEVEEEVVNGESRAAVDLYWLPLGAGGRSVRVNGRIFEAVAAWLGKRPTSDLYHSALVVRVPNGTFVIEMAPIPDKHGVLRGVVAEGPVGSRWARALRVFRYEIRRWRDGMIPDIDEAAESPRRLTVNPFLAQRLLELVPEVPTPVWGRDELGAGEMWNSNSLISWLIVRSGIGLAATCPPSGGRAPGWQAGCCVAGREAVRPESVGWRTASSGHSGSVEFRPAQSTTASYWVYRLVLAESQGMGRDGIPPTAERVGARSMRRRDAERESATGVH
jgi:hypothetical protein